jgi:hypothetical protein
MNPFADGTAAPVPTSHDRTYHRGDIAEMDDVVPPPPDPPAKRPRPAPKPNGSRENGELVVRDAVRAARLNRIGNELLRECASNAAAYQEARDCIRKVGSLLGVVGGHAGNVVANDGAGECGP